MSSPATPAAWALPAGADSDPAFARLHAYWLSRTRGDHLPARPDIDPLEIPRELLPSIALLEIERQADGGRRYRLRLFGSDLEAMTGGSNETGRYYDEVTHQPGLYEKLDQLLGLLVTERRPIYFAAPSGSTDRGFLWFGRLALPLASDGQTVDMILALVRPLPGPPAGQPATSPG
ncbi:PAS domain-containing protein [Ferrovibrio terrae]|uniref:PAS domain-containing protein n=1 Tax=Ferrovibrio terrae TaxID=2594003 RepID=UPI003137CED4